MESIYQYVLEQLAKAKGRWPTVAKETGISLRTIEKIARREIRDPGVSSIERLATYFREPVLHDVSASKKGTTKIESASSSPESPLC